MVSGEQRRDSVIHTCVSVFPQTLLPSRLPHNTEQGSLCYSVGPCCLAILNIAVCVSPSQTPSLLFPSFSPATMSSFSKAESFYVVSCSCGFRLSGTLQTRQMYYRCTIHTWMGNIGQWISGTEYLIQPLGSISVWLLDSPCSSRQDDVCA